ncbi:MAG: MarR family transcriptional regulator, partial [Campylobacterales bacterium]|nr:MarR family transcriptional regulator [Campylobacterales bacterium]
SNGDEPSTARVVDKLEKKGFLKRVTDTEDKRVKLVFATKKTKEILDKLLPFASEINEEIGSCLSKSEKEDLMMLLKKVASSI